LSGVELTGRSVTTYLLVDAVKHVGYIDISKILINLFYRNGIRYAIFDMQKMTIKVVNKSLFKEKHNRCSKTRYILEINH
jgi:hypothetical protein